MDSPDPHMLRRDLSALADGELDPTATRQLLQRLLDEPSAAEELRRLHRLTTAARRAVLAHTPPPSDDLRQRLGRLSASAPTPAAAVRRQPLVAWRVLGGLAAAAVLLLAAGIGIGRWSRPSVGGPRAGGGDAAPVLPAAVVAGAEEVHGICSRLALGLHSGGYPADVAGLAASVEHDLHSDRPYPDLTSIGFAYRGAGPCGKPLADTAHLLYRSLRPGSVHAVSVFVQPWHGQYPIEAGRLYTASVAQNPFPMLAWRTDRVLYFLLADDPATERAAAALIRTAPTTAATSEP